MKRINLLVFMVLIISLFFSQLAYSSSLQILDYPKDIEAGQTAEIKIKWSDIPVNRGLKLRVQLENKDVEPNFFLSKDILDFKSTDSKEVSLETPTDIPEASNYKFVVVFMSKEKEWDEVFIAKDTLKDVEVNVLYKVEITRYPKVIYPGLSTWITVSWKGIPFARGYKLIIQLENEGTEKKMIFIREIKTPLPTGKRSLRIDIPGDLEVGTNYRFVAAVISKSKGWEDTLVADFTKDNVEVRKLF